MRHTEDELKAMFTGLERDDINALANKIHVYSITWWLDVTKPCFDCQGTGRIWSDPAAKYNADELARQKAMKLGQRPCDLCKGLGYPKKERNVGEMLMLMVSELAEAMEGHRKNLQDDKIPHRSMLSVELADCIIRILDMSAALNLDVGGAIVEKCHYNITRADHKPAARLTKGGKQY